MSTELRWGDGCPVADPVLHGRLSRHLKAAGRRIAELRWAANAAVAIAEWTPPPMDRPDNLDIVRGTVWHDPRVPLAAEAGDTYFFRWVPSETVAADTRRRTRKIANRAAKRLGLSAPAIRWFTHCLTIPKSSPEYRSDGYVVAHHPSAPHFWLPALYDGEVTCGLVSDRWPGQIALAYTLEGEALVAAIHHEVRHLAQLRDGSFRHQHIDELEADANQYAARMLRSAA